MQRIRAALSRSQPMRAWKLANQSNADTNKRVAATRCVLVCLKASSSCTQPYNNVIMPRHVKGLGNTLGMECPLAS